MLRKHGVVGKFVEFYGEGVAEVPLANRATLGNMSPEFGSTAAIFPIDQETIDYLKFTGRKPEQLALVEAYAKEQGLWHDPKHEPEFSEYLELDLSEVVPSIAGPKRPQDRIVLSEAKSTFRKQIPDYVGERRRQEATFQAGRDDRRDVPGQRPGPADQRPRRRPTLLPVHSAAEERQRPGHQPGAGQVRRAR